jgi:hypothetical protein
MREIPSEYPHQPWPTLIVPDSERRAIATGQVRAQAPRHQNLLVPQAAPPTQRPPAPPRGPAPASPHAAFPAGYAVPQGYAQPASHQQQGVASPAPASAGTLGTAVVRAPAHGSLAQDLILALPKGAMIGLGAFAIGASLWNTADFLLASNHWVFLLIGAVVLRVLIGTERMLIALVLIGLWFSRDILLHQTFILLWCMGGGIALRLSIDLAP